MAGNLVNDWISSVLAPCSQQFFHRVILRGALVGRGAVLLHDVEYLVPEQVCLLLKTEHHLYEGAGDGGLRGGVLAEEAVIADRLRALYIPGEGLRVALHQPRIYQPVATTFLQPSDRLVENDAASSREPMN